LEANLSVSRRQGRIDVQEIVVTTVVEHILEAIVIHLGEAFKRRGRLSVGAVVRNKPGHSLVISRKLGSEALIGNRLSNGSNLSLSSRRLGSEALVGFIPISVFILDIGSLEGSFLHLVHVNLALLLAGDGL
jgi:hypothetical protein